jgi:transposase-like protein
MTSLTNPIFHDEEAARQHFEALRWPDGPICPHCGSFNNATELKGKSTLAGVYKCKDCRKPFTATISTLYERSHIPLHK